MVVLVIIGFMIAFTAQKLVTPTSEIKSSVRKFAITIKRLRDRARIDNKTYRLVFDLPQDPKKTQSYWVESTDKKALLLTSDEREELEENLEEDDNKQKPDPQGFVTDTKVIKEPPATLPKGLFFDSIELAGKEVETIDSGRVYIYFFPQGYVQGSAIHLTNKETLNWTLAVQSLTGSVDIFNKKMDLEDILEQ